MNCTRPHSLKAILLLLLFIAPCAYGQMVGDQIFLQGKFAEVGVAPNGSLGSTRLPPPGFHTRSPAFNFYDPGLGAFTGLSNQRLMMVYDAGFDGWTVGTPTFFGDYSMPGTPYEGWGIQVNGQHSEAQAQFYQGVTTGFNGTAGLTGTNISYTNPLGKMIGVWQGTAGPGGALSITQTTTLDTTASWVKFKVKFKNTSAAPLPGVYYVRETDPDNDQTTSGIFTTSNVINYQNDYIHRVMVTGTGTVYTTQTLGLSTKDCRAKAFIHSGWPMATTVNLATLWSTGWTGFNFVGPVTNDVAIGIIYNLGTIAAGDSTEINYAYVFNGLLGIDSAIASPQVVVNGIARDTVDTVTSCTFSGSTLPMHIINGDAADWTGSTWTWAPSTYLTTTVGIATTVNVAAITSPITYTVTGTTTIAGCAGRTFLITIMPPGTTPPPTTTTPLSYCVGSVAPPLSATGIGTIWWWTTPTGGTGSTTPPTPSTAAVGTTTWYVSQTVAGCPSNRIPVVVNIFALATPITGNRLICSGDTSTLHNATAGGTWLSGSTGIATVGLTTGLVTGISPGTATISYLVSGCVATAIVTVVTTPAAITGLAVICPATTITLNSSPAGGTWATSSSATAPITSSGVSGGLPYAVIGSGTVGTATITYSFGSTCYSTGVVTVNPNPSPISGPGSICIGATSTYTSAPAPGFWTIGPAGVANIHPVTGAATGIAAGTTIVTYTSGGCRSTLTITVVSAPGAIIGPASVCVGSCATYTNGTPGGSWSSSATGVATVGSSTGLLCGVSVGTTIVTYALSPGCFITRVISVTPTPAAPTGPSQVCVGSSITLTHGTAGGAWTAGCPGVATVPSAGTGTVNGVGVGTCTITYTLPGGCLATRDITVNPLPGTITGPTVYCQGASGTMGNPTPGGTWSSSITSVGTIGASTGIFTGSTSGTTTISYIVTATGCFTTQVVTVSPAPTPIAGTFTVCAGSTTTLTGTPTPGAWSIVPASPVATVSGTGVVTGLTPGTAIVTYTTPSTCFDTAIVTVLDTPTAITGTLSFCVGTTTTLNSTPTGGTWASSATGIGPIISTGVSGGAAQVIIGGSLPGNTNITYTRSNGCPRTVVATVNPLPGAITGSPSLSTCVNSCITLSNTVTGGTWASGNTAVGTVNSTTGVFCGISAGTAGVTYSLGTGCITYTVVTVNALPALIGTVPFTVCEGSCITLTSSPAPGTWASSNAAVGTVNTTGVVCGISAGTTNISYTLATGCRRIQTVTVNGLPAAITGPASICANQCATLTSTPAGGTWTSTNAALGSINATTGVYCGNTATTTGGTSNVTYTLPSLCYRASTIVVNPLPTGVTPAAPQVCEASCTAISGAPAGGIWTSASPAIATISSAGSLCGIVQGTVTLIYTLPTTCSMNVTATVNPLPAAIAGTLTVCVNRTTTLTSTPAGGTWSSPSGNVSVNATTGEVTGLIAGTAAISYTLLTGCRMTAIVTVQALPAAITATPSFGVCVGRTATLNSTPGGTWSIVNTALGTISTGGVLTGVSSTGADTTMVSYTNSNGCVRDAIVTVYAPPTTITGSAVLCVSGTTTLSSAPAGGTWSSSNGLVATVGSNTGVVTGHSGPLTAIITYSLPSGCLTTQAVTVYALPANVTGTMQVCAGFTSTLSTPGSPGGTWSSSDAAVATVDGGGVVTGNPAVMVTSTATITYTLGTGCYKTATVTVNPVPTSISGTFEVCEAYGTTTLTGAPTGGTWSSSAPGIAGIGVSTGVITAGTAGTANITYKLTATGCYRIQAVTVNQLPAPIGGPSAICVNETVTLTSAPGSGTWSSPDGTVSVNSATGAVTGVSAGPATISYANGTTGCVRTGLMTVNPLPAAIAGPLQVCQGFTTALTNASGGGSWSASNPSVGTIDAGGVFTGINGLPAPATSTVSYTFISTGCRITADVTVNRLPSAIMGPDAYCNLSDATYSSSPSGGLWSSSNVADIDFANPSAGIASGHGSTGATITYTLPTGCIATKNVFLILAPYPITGPHEVCYGDTTTIGDTIGGGIWNSDAPFIAPVTPATPTTAIVTGSNVGTANITYTLSTGCFSVHTMTVNPIPSGVTGAQAVCEGLTSDLDNITPGGTWTSTDTSVATIDTFSGLVTGINGGATGRTSVITYALGTGCNAQVTVTVNPLPSVITGTFEVCEGLSTTLVSSPATGTWTSADPAVGTTSSATGIFTGVSAGAPGVNGIGQTEVTYTLPTGCIRTQGVTVNPLPGNIAGVSNICVGDMTVLGNPTPGGTWSSSNPSFAHIDAVTGIVTGISGGNVIITYMMATGCIKTWPMTVNDNPTPIGGSLQVCAAFATNLTSGPAGGVWSQLSSSTVYGTINTVTGVVSGISGGLVPVTYTLGSGCRTTAVVTVITLPPVISGTPNLCEGGGTTTMLHSVPGGTWSISNPSLATIDATTGVVTGIMAGTAVVTYTVGTGCFNVHTITVNPLPAVITGPSPLEVCVGSQITLASATPGGAWISDATDKATIGTSTGVLTGVGAGIAPIRYHISATGCERSVTVTVNPTPAAITGNPHICMGSAVWYTSASMGGVWSISNPGVATLLATTTNVVTALPVSLGVATITYQFPVTGCRALKSVTVQPLPVVYNVTGGGSYCAGGNGVHIGLSNSQTGVSYVLYRGSVAAGYLAGTGFPLDFGLLTVGGTYTVMATNAVSGCERAMAGSATVTVISSVTPTVTLNATPDDSLCPGETVTMIPVTTTGGTAPTYVWKVNGVTVSTGPTYAFVPADGDVASVVMTSNAGCLATTTATASRTITVMPDALPVANVLAGPNDSLCQYAPVKLTASPVFGGSAPTYSWYVNGVLKGSGVSYTYVPANGDLAKVTMTSNYRCRLANTVTSTDVKLYVEPMLIPHVTIYPEPGFAVAAGKPLKLRAVATDVGANPLFQWKVNGYPVAGATADTFTYIFNDYDSITCMVTSSGICGNIGTHDWVFITVNALGAPGVAVLPQDIRLHPNPNRGTFTVRGMLGNNRSEDVEVDITNMLGQVVYKGTMRTVQGKVDAQVIMDNTLANGMYILTLHLEDGKQTFHFVMEQ